MSAPPYMKLFWGDYHRKTRRLTQAAQHGAYMLLIGEAWQSGGTLPDDDALLATWACCTPEDWAAIKPTVMGFFSLRRGKWVHDRVREELANYESTSRKRKEAGKRGGSASRGKEKENQEAIAIQLPTKPESESESEEDKPPISPKGEKRIVLRKADVDAIWSDAPQPARVRSSRDELQKALQAQARAGHAPADVRKGCAGYYATEEASRDGWRFAKGVHRVVSSGRWKDHLAGCPPSEAEPPDPDARWRRALRALKVNQYWNTTDDGPRPGKPGCIVPVHILAEFGITPAEGGQLLPFPVPSDRSAA